MKYVDINKRYTEIIAEYLGNGYIVNTSTMSGSQGEIAKIDLTNGSEIIRVLIEDFDDWKANTSGIQVIVGKTTAEPRLTIWNDRLEVFRTERFYCIRRGRNDVDYSTEI